MKAWDRVHNADRAQFPRFLFLLVGIVALMDMSGWHPVVVIPLTLLLPAISRDFRKTFRWRA